MANGQDAAVAASLSQVSPLFQRFVNGLSFLIDQPVARQPYVLGTSANPGAVIAAGAANQILLAQDFSHNLEQPFEVKRIIFSVDRQHTFRDFKVFLKDLNFAQDFMKNSIMADTLINHMTHAWELDFPWVIRPAGGGWNIFIDNLDAVNPITVNVALQGSLLIPMSRMPR